MHMIHIYPGDSIAKVIHESDPLIHTFFIHRGVYREKIKITRPHLHLIGESASDTIIVYDDYAKKIHADGKEFNTFRTYTMMILSDHVTLENLTIQNDAGIGKIVGQAVALHIMGNHTTVKHCVLDAHQDTLFVGPLPEDLIERYIGFLPDDERLFNQQTHTLFESCHISGDVDFIFGSGTVLFQHCKITMKNSGYLCAPSTYASFPYGMIFKECHIISLGKQNCLLGRPWRSHGKIHFIHSTFEGHFDLERYHHWDKPTFFFYEIPYVSSAFSHPINSEEMEQLNQYVKHHFNCSEKD